MKQKKTKQEVLDASSFISDFTDQSLDKRVAAAKSIHFIAEVLGGERVKAQLIPFLRQEVIYDEAAVVSQLFSNIERLGEYIGGGLPYTFLLPLLEDGLEYEEQKIRKKVVEKYYEVVDRCELPKCENQIIASLKRLYTNEFDEVKEAFCCVVAKKLGLFAAPNQQQLVANYLALVQDASIIRRKYAAKYSKDLVKWLACSQGTILKIVQMLSKDKEESNKIYLIDAVIELSKEKTPATLQSYFNIISYQFSWRIRYELISKIQKLAAAMGKEQFKLFLPYYTKYLNDIEPQIRSIANSKLEEIIPYLQTEDIINRIIPVLKNIPQDTHAYVRNSLANSLLHLCPIVGKKATIQNILPKFLSFLKDEQEQQVKQTIFKKVALICETLGIETLSQSILPVLDEMVASNNWRTRSQSVTILYYLIKNSPLSFITQKIVKIICDFLKDRANSVRKEGVKLILQLIDQHGQVWVQKNIIPKIIVMFKSPTFLHRQTILLALEPMIPKLSVDCLSKNVFSNVFYLVQDPVQNVRMSVCIALGAIYPYLPKEKDSIRKLLKNLKEDKDNDVKEIAAKIFLKLD